MEFFINTFLLFLIIAMGTVLDDYKINILIFNIRKHESLMEELHKKNCEIEALKQEKQRLVALQSAWTPTLSPHH